MKINNIKEKVTHDMEILRKKNQTEIQNTMEVHSSRLEETEDKISELEDEMAIKGKTEELLFKQLKTCERNLQELTNSIKKTKREIICIKEEGVQTKGIYNIFNKIITENSPNLEKTMLFMYRKSLGHQTVLTKIELPHDILSLKQQPQRIEKEY
jgi:septal ring factor EnvC (AmiA/AmiB activator)